MDAGICQHGVYLSLLQLVVCCRGCLACLQVLRWAPWGKGAKLAAQRARSSLPLRGRKATGAATGSLCSSPGGSSTCQPHPGIGSSSGGGGSSGSSTVRQESGGGRNGAGCGRRQGAKKPPPGRGKRRQEDQTPTKSKWRLGNGPVAHGCKVCIRDTIVEPVAPHPCVTLRFTCEGATLCSLAIKIYWWRTSFMHYGAAQ